MCTYMCMYIEIEAHAQSEQTQQKQLAGEEPTCTSPGES